MTDPVPLYFWPEGAWNANRDRVRLAKTKIDTDIKVLPKVAEPGCGRVLLLDSEYPPFVCEMAPVKGSSIEGLRDAIKWCIMGTEDSRALGYDKWLTKAMERKVVEVVP